MENIKDNLAVEYRSQTADASAEQGPEKGSDISLKTLLDAGAHYGHQTQRWNPKMLPYIYGERNRVHILNLDLTLKAWERARRAIVDTVARGGTVLFVGTKPQARDAIGQHARRCNGLFITSRWLGGALSNFETIKISIERMRKLEDFLAQADKEGSDIKLNKREKLSISRELGKLEANLGGIRQMRRPPDIMFVVDIVKEEIAIAEARRLHIPVVGLVDTNADPNRITHPIPSNDDSARTIGLFAGAVADAVIEGRAIYDARLQKQPAESGHERSVQNVNGGAATSSENGSGVHEISAS